MWFRIQVREHGVLARLVFALCGVCLPGVNISAQTSPSVLDWFAAQQTATTGGYNNTNNFTTPSQAASKVPRACQAVGRTDPGAADALPYLDFEPPSNTEFLSRRIVSEVNAGVAASVLATDMLTHKNADSYFRDGSDCDSTLQDTASSLETLAESDNSTGQAIGYGIYLLTSQTTKGSWMDGAGTFSIYLPVLTMCAAWLYRKTYSLTELASPKHKIISF